MATDFWASSQYRRWLVDRTALAQARREDSYYASEEHLALLGLFFANLISKLGKKLDFRQRVIATATVFFRRFYLKNSYCETDPFLVLAACCYVAAKAEETPVHIKNVVMEARVLFNSDEYDINTFPSDNSKLAEMEFYLIDDLECDLTVFHPYRTLLTLCGKEGDSGLENEDGSIEAEAGEVSASGDDPRYWGTGQGKLELPEPALQMAWFIINDTYRSDLCLLYPPHTIAIAAIYLTCTIHSSTRNSIHTQLTSRSGTNAPTVNPTSNAAAAPRRSARQTTAVPLSKGKGKDKPVDIIGWLAALNVNMLLIATIAQEIISLYCLWDRFSDDNTSDTARGSLGHARRGKILSTQVKAEEEDYSQLKKVNSLSLIKMWKSMKESRELSIAQSNNANNSGFVNKFLERADLHTSY